MKGDQTRIIYEKEMEDERMKEEGGKGQGGSVRDTKSERRKKKKKNIEVEKMKGSCNDNTKKTNPSNR